MKKTEILKRLKNDEDYYGDFGKKYLSNSDIYTLLNKYVSGKAWPHNPPTAECFQICNGKSEKITLQK